MSQGIMNFKYTIIGAGVVGLAIARRLAADSGPDGNVLVVEKEKSFGLGISSRNSEVIHSGLYYPEGSLKHRLCLRGRRFLYKYCSARDVPHRKCGKLIIAAGPGEEAELDRLQGQAEKNGVENVARLDRRESLALQPGINAQSSLHVREAGIIDARALMKSFVNDIKTSNGIVAYNSHVISLRRGDNYDLSLDDGTRFASEYVINAAGLSAAAVAELAGVPAPAVYPCKGVYFSYSGAIRCGLLVYPVPEKKLTGLGVHATIDLAGRMRFGPDAEYINGFDDFSVGDEKKDFFYQSAQKLFPGILPDELSPDMAGIRPKLQGPGDSEVKDFYIREESDRGFPRFINCIGIESPGLTSAMAIADHIATILSDI
jgi:L-2-hydroxyglutarate oxidase LhgO